MKTPIGIAFGLALLSSTALASGAVTNGGHSRGTSGAKFQVTDLVSDQSGMAALTDPDLVNAWGIAQGGPAGKTWVSDNGSGKSTVYNHLGAKEPITVAIADGEPTGVTFIKPDPNGDTIFPVTENGTTASSLFVFVTENGRIEGWSSIVDEDNSIVAVDNSATGADYKGVAISNKKQELFAANFQNNEIEVYDKNFKLTNSFTDTQLPQNYAPFNVMVDRGLLYVAFAERGSGGDEVTGAGLGYIDVFRRDGHLLTRLVAQGALNAPWGMAIAPSTFGQFAGALLVGNFGDGKINAYDKTTGTSLGALSDSTGAPIAIDGLWGIQARPLGKITFAAGPDAEAHGLMGTINAIAQ